MMKLTQAEFSALHIKPKREQSKPSKKCLIRRRIEDRLEQLRIEKMFNELS